MAFFVSMNIVCALFAIFQDRSVGAVVFRFIFCNVFGALFYFLVLA